MRSHNDIKYEPIWDEEKINTEGRLEKALKNFDPTVMPEPEHSCHRMRKRLKIVQGNSDD